MERFPRLLFHGTTGFYLERQVARHGIYRHDPDSPYGDIWLTCSPDWASHKANEQMFTHHVFGRTRGAIVMVVDTKKLQVEPAEIVYPNGTIPAERTWRVESINVEACNNISVIGGVNHRTQVAIGHLIDKMLQR